jgi:reductive dehalogenase
MSPVLERPTYDRDRSGPIGRVDERDVLFARTDLFRRFPDGSAERDEYYSAHPEALEYDRRMAEDLHLGSGGGELSSLSDSIFHLARIVAREDAVDGEPAAERVGLDPSEAATRVKTMATALGADIVRTGPLRIEWTYSHVGRSYGNASGFRPWGTPIDVSHHPNAVSMGFRMDPDLTSTAPEFPTLLATATAYVIGAVVAVRLAAYIRSLGYSARAHHVYNYGVLPVPVAVDCGLGELSRAGYMLSREFGLGLRLGTVTTDLPLTHDGSVDLGVQSFCERCEICAEDCPSGAIPKGPKTEYNGVRKWKLDAEKCYHYWSVVSTDCSVCMSTCPWTRPDTWLHRGLTALAMVRGPHQRLMALAGRFLYGRPDARRYGRSVGMASLRPRRLRPQMRALGVTVAVLYAIGLWWGAGAGGPSRMPAGGWGVYSLWLCWTIFGIAAVWTFLAERSIRPALTALVFFAASSGLLWPVVGW